MEHRERQIKNDKGQESAGYVGNGMTNPAKGGGPEKNEGRMVEAVMNPVRMRIIQYLILREQGTVKEIGKELSDIPAASLYRHVNRLAEAGLLKVLKERRIRGTVEKVFGLNPEPMGDYGTESIKNLVNGTLLTILAEFNRYLDSGNADPAADLVGVSSSVLLLTDEELNTMTGRLGAVLNDYVENRPGPGRKARRLTTILSPPGSGDGTDTEQE